VNHDGIADLTLAFSNGGGQVTLLGVHDINAVHTDPLVASGGFVSAEPPAGLDPHMMMLGFM